jgi:transketolase
MMRLGDHCGSWLAEEAAKDERIWCLDGDLADSDGAIHFAQKHPERFIMAGIAEQSMVSMAAGMASCGLRPWVFSFASFLAYRAYDQVRICLSQARQPVTLVGSHSGGLSNRNGKSHAALNDIALMVTLPYMQVWSPADVADLHFASRSIIDAAEPAYLRLPRRPLGPVDGTPGLIRIIRKPQPVTIVSTGLGTHLAVETAALMETQGISVGLVHCLRLSPFPEEELAETLRGVKKIIVIEDHVELGGLFSIIQSLQPGVPVVPIGWPRNWSGQSGADESLLEMHGMKADQIAEKIQAW